MGGGRQVGRGEFKPEPCLTRRPAPVDPLRYHADVLVRTGRMWPYILLGRADLTPPACS